MSALRNLALGLFILVAVLIGVGFALPDSTHVERSISVNARPSTVFTLLNTYSRFNEWSPWAELDPQTQYSISGPVSGVGARLAWTSQDPQVGSGSQEIIESVPFERIATKLVFNDFPADNTATYTLTPQGQGTLITWGYDVTYHGSLLFRYFGLMLDRMIGPDYERGLAKLKPLVEALPQADISGLKAQVVETPALSIAYVTAESQNETTAIGNALAHAYNVEIMPFTQKHQLTQTGAPLAIYDSCDKGAPMCLFRAGIPVDRADVTLAAGENVHIGQTYAGRALKVTHRGAYSTLPATYGMVDPFLLASGLQRNGTPWEQYDTDPAKTPEADWITHIYVPLK